MTEEIMDVSTEVIKPAETTAPTTEPTSWMNTEGEFGEGVPEGIKTLLDKKQWTNINQLADGYSELEKFKGVGKHLVIPEVDDIEGWGKIYDELGRPETHDKYTLDYEGDIPISDELTGQFKQFAHGLGLTQKQFNDIITFQIDAVAAQEGAFNEQTEVQKQVNIQTLKDKFCEANYQTKITGARIIADSLGIYQTLEDKGLASDPDIISMLDTIVSRTSEDVITPQSPRTAEKTPIERLNEIKQSKAFLQRFDPGHKKIMAEYMQLNQEIANSGQSQRPKT